MKNNRELFIAGNWKMNTSVTEGVKLAEGLTEKYGNIKGVRLAVAVPFTHISDVGKVIKGTSIELAAQNMNENEKGAFTGEISALMLKDLGVKLVIIGHSERRHIYGESNETIALKVKAVLNAGFECILCIGETREERESGMLEKVLKLQVESALCGLSTDEIKRVIIAYEPVWAIGTGLTASKEDAENAHKFIRKTVSDIFDESVAQKIIIQYGGSVNASNSASLLSAENIDGALVGGASLSVEKFSGIIDSVIA